MTEFLFGPKKLTIPAVNHPEYISKVVASIVNDIERSSNNIPMALFLEIAAYEALKNAIVHGCHGQPVNDVQISYGACNEKLFIEIRDPGQGFEVEKHLKDDTLWKPGMGITLIRSVVDQVEYNEKGNRIRIVKYLPKFNITCENVRY